MDSKTEDTEQRENTYPFLIDYIPEEYRKKAEKELNETPENSTRLLQDFKSMTKSEKALDGIDFHEDFLRHYLRHSKYDVKKALKRLTAYIKFKRSNSTYFENVDLEKLSKTPDYTYCTPLPWRCRDGCAILFYDLGKWHPDNIPLEDLFRLGLTVTHQCLRNPVTQINGLKMICDWKGASLYQLKYVTPATIYRSYQAFLTLTPGRIKEIHMVNESLTMRIFWSIFKPFLSAKLKSRYIFHSSPKELLNYFPKHVVPTQFGGDLEVSYMEDWVKEANEQQRISTLAGQCNKF